MCSDDTCIRAYRDISFLTGKGNLKIDIPVQPVYKLGHRRASAILLNTRLPCSNRIGHVWTICRENQRMVDALESLGHRDLSQEEYDQLERFVCQLYKSKVYNKVNEFRWFLYSNRAAEWESLPPTTHFIECCVHCCGWQIFHISASFLLLSLFVQLTNTAYSTSTLRSNDLEKGRGKPSTPPVSGRLWLGV